MTGDWVLDRLTLRYAASYDLVITAEGFAAVPHETGRETLRAHSSLVLGVLLDQATAETGQAEPPLARCRRQHQRVQGIHAAREARR